MPTSVNPNPHPPASPASPASPATKNWALAPVPAPPVVVTAPEVSGTAGVGNPLTSTTGTWANSPTSYAYQWLSSATGDISGAITDTYTPVAGDSGADISCQVTAANSKGSAASTSNVIAIP